MYTNKALTKLTLAPLIILFVTFFILEFENHRTTQKLVDEFISFFEKDVREDDFKLKVITRVQNIKNLIEYEVNQNLTKDKKSEEIAKNRVINQIKALNKNYGNEYIFVYDLHNINGGENFATRLITKAEGKKENILLSSNYEDKNGFKYREKMLNELKKHNEAYISYLFSDTNSKKDLLKYTYFYLQKDWNWIIACGFYEKEISEALNNFYYSTKDTTEYLHNEHLVILLISFFVLIISAYFIMKRYKDLILKYIQRVDYLNQKSQRDRKKYKALLELATDGIHILDKNGNIINCSQSFAQMLGYDYKEIKKLNVKDWDILLPENELFDEIQRIIKYSKTFYTKHKKKNGEIIDVQISAKGINIDNVDYLYASSRDVTKMLSYEKEILEKTKLLAQSEKITHLGSWSLDLIENKLLWSDEIYNIFELDKDKIEPSYDIFMEAIHPEDRELVNNAYAKSVKEKTFYDVKHRLLLKNGKTKYVRERGVTQYNAQAQAISSKGTIQDITKEYFLENEFETIFNHSFDGIAILDLKSNFLKFNKAYLKMTGFSEEELLKKSCIELTSKEDKEHSKEIINRVIKTGYVENFEKTCILKDDKRVVVSMSLTLLPDEEKILITTKDITNLKLLEKREKLASMGELISNIAHQWRQPLNVISTCANGLKFENEIIGNISSERINEFSNEVTKQVQYLSKTIDDFRSFAKENDENKLSVSLVQTINKTLNLLRIPFQQNFIEFVLDLEDDFVIESKQTQLMQAFINILNNCKDAINENSDIHDNRFIFISTKNDAKSFRILIKDSGGGIKLENKNKIFEPYFTTKHQSLGTGIGLTMSYKILHEINNANVIVTNESYKYKQNEYTGALFSIVFEKGLSNS